MRDDHQLALRGQAQASERRPDWRSRRLVAAVLLGYLLAAVLVTWRLWADPATRTVAGNPDDADLFAWYMRYAAAAVSHGTVPGLVTGALNAPQGVNLMWNSSLLLPCTLLAPLTLLAGPQASLTVLTTAGFAGSAAAMFWVLRRWRLSVGSAALAGAVYGFSPALLHSAIGHYNLQLAMLPPLIVDAGLRVAVGRALAVPSPLVDGAWLGLLVAAELFISEELALTTAFACAMLAAWLAVARPAVALRRLRDDAAGLAAGLAAAACVTLALAGWGLWTQFAGPLAQSGSPFIADFYENDVTSFVTPSGYLFFHTSASAAAAARYQGLAPEYLGYLGWPLIAGLALAVIVFASSHVVRALALTLATLAVLSLGGHPLVDGTTHAGVALPWRWIEGLPLAGSVLPDRLSILIDGTAAALLAVCLDLARARLRPAVLASVLAVLVCLPLLPRPLPAAAAPPLPSGWNTALDALRLPAGSPILLVPVPQVHLTMAMRWQADTPRQYALVGGYFIGPAWNGRAYIDGNGLAPTAAYLDWLWAAGLPPGSAEAAAAASAHLAPPGAAPAPAQVRADLAAWRPAAVVAVATAGSPLARYLVGLFGAPSVQSGDILAWRLR